MKPHESHNLHDQLLKAQSGLLLSAQSGLPLAFAVGNNSAPGGGPVVYISTNASLGTVTINIQNNSGAPLSLTTSSVLSIAMFPLMLPADIGKVKVAPDNPWSVTYSDKSVQLSPTGPLRINATLQIQLVNVLSSQTTDGTGYFTFAYSGFSGVPVSSVRVNVQRLHPADAANANVTFSLMSRGEYGNTRDLVYLTTWSPPVGETGIANWILPTLSNNDNAKPLPLGTKSQIQLSFLSGNGVNALCTDEQLAAIASSVQVGDPGSTWTVTLNKEDVAPIFVITPNAGNPYFLAAAGGTIELKLGNLISFLPEGPTPVFLLYSGIPGFNSGYQMLMLNKSKPVPALVSFDAADASGKPVPVDTGVVYQAPLTLNWKVFAAQSVSLVVDGTATPFGPKAGTVVHPVQQPSVYALTPLVNGQPSGLRPTLEFNILPPAVTLGYTVTNGQAVLNWTAVGADYCTLTVDGVQSGGNLPASGSQNVQPVGSHVYVVTGFQSSGPKLSAASAPLTIDGPDASISATGTHWFVPSNPSWQYFWNCKISWSTKDAATCSVTRKGWNDGLVSNALQGSWDSGKQQIHDADYPANLGFQITAVAANGISITRPADIQWSQKSDF